MITATLTLRNPSGERKELHASAAEARRSLISYVRYGNLYIRGNGSRGTLLSRKGKPEIRGTYEIS